MQAHSSPARPLAVRLHGVIVALQVALVTPHGLVGVERDLNLDTSGLLRCGQVVYAVCPFLHILHAVAQGVENLARTDDSKRNASSRRYYNPDSRVLQEENARSCSGSTDIDHASAHHHDQLSKFTQSTRNERYHIIEDVKQASGLFVAVAAGCGVG